MKLSILIPTYNQDCRQLVESLVRLCHLPDDCEIIVGDDGSTDSRSKEANRELCNLGKVTYWESPENLGRARIRNRLAQMSKGEYLLFIDSDARVDDADFIEGYLRQLPTDDVLCGGYYSDSQAPPPQRSLRWRYEKACEKRLTPENRNKRPHQNIATFNILIPRNVAESHPFDERIKRYGYEDTLLGQELEEAGIGVRHIGNPLVHTGLDTNEHFLAKTEEAMQTLHDIRHRIGDKSHLLSVYDRLHKWHLTKAAALAFRHCQKLMRSHLQGGSPSIWMFNLYKLGFYCNLEDVTI